MNQNKLSFIQTIFIHIVVIFVLYGVHSLLFWSLDPSEWHIVGRLSMLSIWYYATFVKKT